MQNSHRKFLDVVYFIFLSDKEAEVWIGIAKFLQLRSDGSDIEFLMQFAATVFKGLVVEENDVRFGELFPCFFWNSNIQVFMERRVHKSDLVVIDHLEQGLFSIQ